MMLQLFPHFSPASVFYFDRHVFDIYINLYFTTIYQSVSMCTDKIRFFFPSCPMYTGTHIGILTYHNTMKIHVVNFPLIWFSSLFVYEKQKKLEKIKKIVFFFYFFIFIFRLFPFSFIFEKKKNS